MDDWFWNENRCGMGMKKVEEGYGYVYERDCDPSPVEDEIAEGVKLAEMIGEMRRLKEANERLAAKTKRDPVGHYIRGGLECIDVIKAISTEEEYRGYLRLSAVKYLWRLGEKDDPAKEAKKAEDFVRWLKESLEEQE